MGEGSLHPRPEGRGICDPPRSRCNKIVWAELQRQLDAMGLKVKRGTIQDATFIETDQGSNQKAARRSG